MKVAILWRLLLDSLVVQPGATLPMALTLRDVILDLLRIGTLSVFLHTLNWQQAVVAGRLRGT
jgi:hypothetical protein